MIKLKSHLNNVKNLYNDFKSSLERTKIIKNKYDFKKLKKVRISVKDASFDGFIKLQTPDQLGVVGNTAFLTTLKPNIDLVLNKPNPLVMLNSNIERNWLLHIEPPGYIQKLGLDDEKVLKNFGRVYTSDPKLYEKGGKFIASPPYVHWHLANSSYSSIEKARYDFNFLANYKGIPQKEVDLVTINSHLSELPGHKLRAEFVAKTCDSNIGLKLYGTSNWSKFKQYQGPTTFGKWPIYSPSKYVLAIENEVSPYYWTEKFTDAVLCFSMPIYYGCPRINEYFPEGSYIPLDITRKTAIDDLKEIMKSDYYEKNINNLLKARNLILKKYNLFNFIDKEINT